MKIKKIQVMPIYRKRLGDHPFTATILNNLSNNHCDLEEFVAAKQYAKQALVIRLKLLADHRDTTKSCNGPKIKHEVPRSKRFFRTTQDYAGESGE